MVKVKGLAFEDVHKRVNYLYQVANQSLVRNPEDPGLCRFYVNTLMVIARRQGIQLHPDIKRRLCKRCCVLLIPGLTAVYRVKKKQQKQTLVTCLGCGTLRRFVYNDKMVPWVDRPDAWIDTVVNGQSVTVQQYGKAKGSNKGGSNKNSKKQTNQTKGSAKEQPKVIADIKSNLNPSQDLRGISECKTENPREVT